MYVDSSIRKELRSAQDRFQEAREAFEELKETLEVLADKKLLAGIKASERDFASGKFKSIASLKA